METVGKLLAVVIFVVFLTLLITAISDGAQNIEVLLTSDNHYALYTGTEEALTYGGRNESQFYVPGEGWGYRDAEQFTLTPDPCDTYLYVAAWSFDFVTQGVRGEFTQWGITSRTGDLGWECMVVGGDIWSHIDRMLNWQENPVPTVTEVAADIGAGVWRPAVAGDSGGAVWPWGDIAGMTDGPKWMSPGAYFDFWRDLPEWFPWQLRKGFVGFNPHEYVLYRHPINVVEPSALIFMLGGLLGAGVFMRLGRLR